MADVTDAETVDMRRVVREGALLAGAGRAILLQVAQPGVGRGVAEHSDFRYRQVDRLRTTLTYVYCMTFGTPEERSRISRIVTAVHRRVRGPGYSALDPELQLWVAATLYDTAVMLYEQWFGVFDETTADAVYQQYRVLGTGLQVTPEMWPASRAAFREYWDHMIATIEVGDRSRQVCQDLLYPRKL